MDVTSTTTIIIYDVFDRRVGQVVQLGSGTWVGYHLAHERLTSLPFRPRQTLDEAVASVHVRHAETTGLVDRRARALADAACSVVAASRAHQ